MPEQLAQEGLELSTEENGQKLEGVEFQPIGSYFEAVIKNGNSKFRDNVEADPLDDTPDLTYGDSESDEEPGTPANLAMMSSLCATSAGIPLGKTVVENVALILPKGREGGYVDVPVIPITTTEQGNTELLAIVGKDQEEAGNTNVPFLLMPKEDNEEEPASNQVSADFSQLMATSLISNISQTTTDAGSKAGAKKKADYKETDESLTKENDPEKEEKEETGKVAKGKLEGYVLSGDIRNLFGIKGLKGKLYKFKGPETKKEEKKADDDKDGKKGKGEKEDELPPTDDEGIEKAESKVILAANSEKPRKDGKDEKPDDKGEKKEDKDGKKDGKDKKKEKEPAREKVKINPKSLSLLGKPLGTLFPFLESDEIKNLPIESLEFTYCEEKSGHFFPPGFRLEIDVLLKDSLQWASDAFQKMFGDKRVPKKLHLSADLGKTRNWSKRPKVEDFALRGYFTEFGSQAWDILQIKELGLELTATKAASNKPSDKKVKEEEGNDGKENKDDKGEKKQSSSDPTEGKQGDESQEAQDEEAQPKSNADQTSLLQANLTSKKPQAKQDTPDAGVEEESSLEKAKEKKDDEEDEKDEKDEKNDKDGKEKKDKKDKKKQSYNYGFGFFGTVAFIKVPHANSPLDMHIRIARDFEIEKKDDKEKGDKKKDEKDKAKEKKDEKRDEGKQDTKGESGKTTIEKKARGEVEGGNDSKEATEPTTTLAVEETSAEKTKDDSEEKEPQTGAKDEDKKKAHEKKTHSDGKHKRIWKVVITCDEWKDIYGVKNVTMKKAELKWSFEQGDFKETMAFELSGEAKLGAGSFKVKGKISRGDYFVDAEVGDLTLTDIKKIHAQIQGQEVPEEKKADKKIEGEKDNTENTEKEKKKKAEEKKDEEEEAKGNELTFKKLHLNLSRKFMKDKDTTNNCLLLEGNVTFNGKSSATALLQFSTDGLTIEGGLADFNIPDTPVKIEKAQMLIFIGFNHKDKNEKDDKKSREKAAGDKNSIKDVPASEDKVSEIAEAQESVASKSEDTGSKKDSTGANIKPDKDAGKEVKKPTDQKKKPKRESEFAVLGIVKIHKVSLSVGLYTARGKDKEKRDWLAFASVDKLTLSQLVPDIKDPSFNIQLDNIALIASSEDREVKEEEDDKKDKKNDGKDDEKKDGKKEKKKDEKDGGKVIEDRGGAEEAAVVAAGTNVKDTTKAKDEGKTDKKKDGDKKKDADKKKDGDKKDKKPAHAGVLEKVESYKYPIRKGVQLCATIRKFEPIEHLNKKEPIDGLVLIIAFTPEGLEISIDMPKHFEVLLRPDVILGEFGATIHAAEGALELHSTMKLTFDDQAPIRVKGRIKGSTIAAEGELFMHPSDKWINPFKLNNKVVISRLGVGAGFNYATVCAQGPDKLSFSGTIDIGQDFHAAMALKLGITKEQVILVELSEFNISKLLRLAGEMTEIKELQTLNGGEDFLVFREIKFFMSTGGLVLGIRYEKGIHVKGMMEFFGKKGEFDGQIFDGGVKIKGGLDHFKIGGLEVQSARAEDKRATMDIEMTGEKQRIFVDGRITFYALDLSIFIDAYMQERRLEAEILLSFTESIALHLRAKAEIPSTHSLEGVVMEFTAEIRPDVVGAFFKAIDEAIGVIGKLASDSIKNIEEDLQRQVDEKRGDLDQLQNELKTLKAKVNEEVLERQEKIEKEGEERRELEQKLNQLKKAVDEAKEEKRKNDSKIKKVKSDKEKIEREYENKIRNKKSEYERQIEQQRQEKERYEKEQKRLEDQKEASFGDILRSSAEADRSWKWWCTEEENKEWWWNQCRSKAWKEWEKPWWKIDRAYVTKWNLQADYALAELNVIRLKKAVDAELRHAAKKVFDTDEWKSIERELKKVGEKIEDIGEAVGHILQGKSYEAIEALQRDRDRELDAKIDTQKKLIKTSKEIEKKLKSAIEELEKNKGHITKREEELQKDIEKLKGELKTRPFEDDYRYKLQEHEAVEAQVQNIQKKLSEIQEGIDRSVEDAQRRLHVLEQDIPTVKLITVTASTDVFVTNKPLTFKVEGRWKREPVRFEVQWAPGWSVPELFDTIGHRLLDTAGNL